MGIKNRQYRNQTALHEWLTKKTYNFLREKCTQKGLIWRQEHTIHNGMRPDATAFCSLQLYWEKKLVGKSDRDIMDKEAIDFMFIFEAKVSITDLRNTFNGNGQYKEQPYSNFHFLVVPRDFTKTYNDLPELPSYWGILEPYVSALQIIRKPVFQDIDRLFFLEAAYTILFKNK